jgi:hypothetical protein
MTLAELDHINQLVDDRRDMLEAINSPSKIGFEDSDAEVFPEVENLLKETLDSYKEQRKLLLQIEVDKIENTLKEKYNLDLTVNPEASN